MGQTNPPTVLAFTAMPMIGSTVPVTGSGPMVVAGRAASGSEMPILVDDVTGAVFVTGALGVAFPTSVIITGSVAIDNWPDSFGGGSITNSVSVYTQGAQLVSGSVNVSGTIALDRGNSALNPLYVSGLGGAGSTASSLGVYTHGAQLVSGSVNVYTSGLQGVSGTVNVSGPVQTYGFGVQAVSGSVSVFTQGAQLVSGTVTAEVSGTIALDRGNSALNPLYVSGLSGGSTGGGGSVYTQGAQLVSGSVSVYTQGAQLVSGTLTMTATGSLPVTGSGQFLVAGSTVSGSQLPLRILDNGSLAVDFSSLNPPDGGTITGNDDSNALGSVTGLGYVTLINDGPGIIRVRSSANPPTSGSGFPMTIGSYSWNAKAIDAIRVYVPISTNVYWGVHQ